MITQNRQTWIVLGHFSFLFACRHLFNKGGFGLVCWMTGILIPAGPAVVLGASVDSPF